MTDAPTDNAPGGVTSREPDRRRGLVIAMAGGAFALGMLGASFAAVPLYTLFCQVTGYGGTTQRAEENRTAVSERQVTVRFDANASPGVPWSFRPVEREIVVRFGETRQTAYRVTNTSDAVVTAQATFNVTPPLAGAYFNKIQCFCFSNQTLKPGETVDMPVVFFVDPAMLDVPEMANAPTITLSYTFFPVEGGVQETAAAASPPGGETDAAAGAVAQGGGAAQGKS